MRGCIREGVVEDVERLPAVARRQSKGRARAGVRHDDLQPIVRPVPEKHYVEAVAPAMGELDGGVGIVDRTGHGVSFLEDRIALEDTGRAWPIPADRAPVV